jgi:hypothetical protein
MIPSGKIGKFILEHSSKGQIRPSTLERSNLGPCWGHHLRTKLKANRRTSPPTLSRTTRGTRDFEGSPKVMSWWRSKGRRCRSLDGATPKGEDDEAWKARLDDRWRLDEARVPKANTKGTFGVGTKPKGVPSYKVGLERKLRCTPGIFEEYSGWGVKICKVPINSPITRTVDS